MHIAKKSDIHTPITNDAGEIIYDLIGAQAKHGGARQHSLALIVIPPGKSSERHYHPSAEETYYILRGKARIVIDGEAFELAPGQACCIEPPERHQIFNAGEDDLEFLVVCAPPWTPDISVFE